MNLRLFSLALLLSAVPSLSSAGSKISLNQGDFISAKRISKDGETVLSVKLSKSGKAKIRKLNESSIGTEVETSVAGITKNFQLKEPIQGTRLEMGPFSGEEAEEIAALINGKN